MERKLRNPRDGKSSTERILHLLMTGEYSDVTFLVGPKPVPIHAHKLILTTASCVFRAMFYGSLPEKSVVAIPDIRPEVFKDLLSYIYSDRTAFYKSDVTQLFAAAHKYDVKNLEDQCAKHLAEKIGPNNACKFYEMAELYNNQTMLDKCVQIFQNDTQLVLLSPSFLEAKLSTVLKILSLKKLYINSELDLFNAIEHYTGFTRKRRQQINKTVAPKRLRLTGNQASTSQGTLAVGRGAEIPNSKKCKPVSEVRCLLRKIRFLTMTSVQFAKGPALSPLLTEQEKLALRLNISSGKHYKAMPFGFSHSKIKRNQGSKPVTAILIQPTLFL